ncbi:MAG TPA: hypothetical protein VIF62_15790 [Labilithrix sp.]
MGRRSLAAFFLAGVWSAACATSDSGPVGSVTDAASQAETKSFCSIALGAPACKPFDSLDACAGQMAIFNEAFVNALSSCAINEGCGALGTQFLYLGPTFDSDCAKNSIERVDGAPGARPDVAHCTTQNDACKTAYVMDAAQSATIHGVIGEHCLGLVTLTSDARAKAAHCADLACADFQSCLGDVFGKWTPPKNP